MAVQQNIPPEPDPDRDLVERIRSGELALFHELVSRHQAAIFRGAMAILKNEADAQDVTQETFLRAFRHLESFRGEAKFRTWLIQIAVNISRSRLKSIQRESWEPLQAGLWKLSGGTGSPEQEYSWKEVAGQILQALQGMHPSYRSVLFMRDVQNLSTGDVALALGMTEENVRTRLRRARADLRGRVQQYWQTWKERRNL